MKKLFLILLLLHAFSCTDNQRARKFGGKETIELPKGFRLLTATWKQDNLWYTIEAMPEGYSPSNKIFKESSNFGAWEGQITFVESK